MHFSYSAGFLKGRMAGGLVEEQSGFHFLFFFISAGLFAAQQPSFVISNTSVPVTPFFLMHISANRSSPMGPYFPFSIPTFQSLTVSVLHVSTFAKRMLNAVFEITSKFPKKPYFTPSQLIRNVPVGGTGIRCTRATSFAGKNTASASALTVQSYAA